MEKGNEKIIEEIIDEVIKLRVQKGYSNGSLIEHIKNKYKVKKTKAYELLKIARQRVGEYHYKVNENVMEDSLEFLERMRQTSIERGDMKLALEVQKELNKLNQLHIQKIELDSKVEMPLFNIEQIKKND